MANVPLARAGCVVILFMGLLRVAWTFSRRSTTC